jgi:RHS repeat-associated protein
MFTGGGAIVSRYEYDPYGRSTTITGPTSTDFNFTGLYRHAKSNLDLATYRAYDPDLGRWLNRDPAGEDGGQNLYAYVSANPADTVDPSGLFGAKQAYNDWLDIAANGLTRGGFVGYTQADIGILGMTAIDFWLARTLENNAERSGAASGAGCTGDAWKYGSLAAGQIAWQAFGGYIVNTALNPFFRFLGPGSRPGFGTGTWLARGAIDEIPFGSVANAASKLQIPTESEVNTVVRATNVWWRYIAGPRAATKFPEYGAGGGAEYRVGGWGGQ